MKLVCWLPLFAWRPFFLENNIILARKSKNFQTDLKVKAFSLARHPRIPDNFILTAPPKTFLAITPISVRNSAFSDMEILICSH